MSDLSESLALNLSNVQRLDNGRDISGASEANQQPVTLDDLLITDPTSTVIFPVRDPAAEAYGLKTGDLLVVDRSAKPAENQLVIVLINDELSIQRFIAGQTGSFGANQLISSINHQGAVWGVVTYCILRQR
jgi:SOS-response transcriptional repressor LexA